MTVITLLAGLTIKIYYNVTYTKFYPAISVYAQVVIVILHTVSQDIAIDIVTRF